MPRYVFSLSASPIREDEDGVVLPGPDEARAVIAAGESCGTPMAGSGPARSGACTSPTSLGPQCARSASVVRRRTGQPVGAAGL